MEPLKSKLGFNAVRCMTAGSMIGGGIFPTLCLVMVIAGSWAWLRFILAVFGRPVLLRHMQTEN